MADLNRLRAKYAVDRSAIRRDDGLKTFEWKGPDVRCIGCGQKGRNLNSDQKCTECMGVGKAVPSAEWDPLAATVAKSLAEPPKSMVDLSTWPRNYAPRPDTYIKTTRGAPFDDEPTLPLDDVELYIHTNEGYNKFYRLARYGWVVKIRWGKIGSHGQEQVKAFSTESEAMKFVNGQVHEKESKGYSPAFVK